MAVKMQCPALAVVSDTDELGTAMRLEVADTAWLWIQAEPDARERDSTS